MDEYETLSHTTWDCKYHIVFIPKYRRKTHQGQERDPHGPRLWRAQTQFRGTAFLGPGIFVNTVGRDEEAIRAYIRNQEKEDQRLEQMNLWR